MKKLYFEGAGMFGCRDTAEELRGNCRLRTMFHDDQGRAVYLEILSGQYKTAGRLYVDSCHYIGKDGCNLLRLPVERDGKQREYTPAGILALLDEIGAHFDAVEVLPRLAGYQVFADEYRSGDTEAEYMRGDTFVPNLAEIARREAVYNALCDAERAAGVKWPCVSLWPLQDRPNVCRYHLPRTGAHGEIIPAEYLAGKQ